MQENKAARIIMASRSKFGCPICGEENVTREKYNCGFSGTWLGSDNGTEQQLQVNTECNGKVATEKTGNIMNQEEVISKLQSTLQQAQVKLIEQQTLLKSILDAPQQFGTVIEISGKEAIIAVNRQLFEMKTSLKVVPGSQVKLFQTQEGYGITSVSEFQPLGQVVFARKVIEENIIQIGGDGSSDTLVYAGSLRGKIEPGDRVMLDISGQVIVRNLGQEKKEFAFTESTGITWNDIGGLQEAKELMIEAIELPYRYSELYKTYNKKPIKGVLLYGPPGTGKTLLGKAAATAIAKVHSGKGVGTGFLYIKGPEILSKWVGASEEKVRELFTRARKHKEKHGYPAVIFIDEADAVLRKRGAGVSSDMESTVVPAFLAEMDGLNDSGAVVILATNRPDTLDNAVTRDGRIDRSIRVGRPDQNAAIDIFKIHLRGVPCAKGDAQYIAKIGATELYSNKRVLYEFAANDGKSVPFTLGNLCNGAMISGVIGQATSFAMKRDIRTNNKKPGILPDDVISAVNNIYQQNIDLNHKDELSDFLEPIRDGINGVKKLRQCAPV